jgi:hypothetical protein
MASRSDLSKPVTLIQGFSRDVVRSGPGPANWADDLSAIALADWGFDLASQLLERAGFGDTPEEVARLAQFTPERAVATLLDYRSVPNQLEPFEHSGVWDPSLRNFPISRPAATDRAEKTGESMGVRAKPAGCSRLSTASSIGCAPPTSRRAASRIGGPTAWSRPNVRSKRKWRCSGTAISPPAKKKSATTARWSSSLRCSTGTRPETSAIS